MLYPSLGRGAFAQRGLHGGGDGFEGPEPLRFAAEKKAEVLPALFFREMNGLMLVRTILRSELAETDHFRGSVGARTFQIGERAYKI
jgi:hypothetical protein